MQEIFPCPCHRAVLQSEVTVRLPTDMHNLIQSRLSPLARTLFTTTPVSPEVLPRDNQFVSGRSIIPQHGIDD